jgi:predicted nucleic acid-binding Zn finger protein
MYIRQYVIYRHMQLHKNRNLVIEVEAKVRKILLQSKIKLGWYICKAEDYVVATRCFNCSRYNHRHNECKNEEACPKCAGAHRLKDCAAEPNSFKCVNCTIYNKYNPHKNICTNHSSLDKNCPSMIAILERYRRNTEY